MIVVRSGPEIWPTDHFVLQLLLFTQEHYSSLSHVYSPRLSVFNSILPGLPNDVYVFVAAVAVAVCLVRSRQLLLLKDVPGKYQIY